MAEDAPDRFQTALAKADTIPAVERWVESALEDRGFQYFAYVQLVPLRGSSGRLYVGNYHEDWSDRYDRENLDLYDPLYTMALDAPAPFFWDDIKWTEPEISKVREPARAYGLRSGVGIPLSEPDGTKAGMQIVADIEADEFRERFAKHKDDLLAIARAMHHRVTELAMKEAGWGALEGRKGDVLLLVARGQSNPQIAATLKLSANTVKGYVDELFTLFGVNSRAALAAKAAMLQLVVP